MKNFDWLSIIIKKHRSRFNKNITNEFKTLTNLWGWSGLNIGLEFRYERVADEGRWIPRRFPVWAVVEPGAVAAARRTGRTLAAVVHSFDPRPVGRHHFRQSHFFFCFFSLFFHLNKCLLLSLKPINNMIHQFQFKFELIAVFF